jgi:hypothetical protein
LRYHEFEEFEDLADRNDDHRDHRPGRGDRRRRRHKRDHGARPDAKPFRADGRESFKCGHCKAFIGPTVSGGRHRNHCPLCLYSRHVDGPTPGDRASECRSLMAPIGTFFRPKGEQAIVHRCLGCGLERHCRVAADDNIVTCLHLPLIAPRTGRADVAATDEDEVAIA